MTDIAIRPSGSSVLYRVNPVSKLAAAVLMSVCLILTIDIVSAGVALVLQLVFFAVARIDARRFWLRTLPVWIAAPFTGLTIALYGQTSGTVYAEFLLARVSDGSLELAAATTLRVLAIGLPAVVLFMTIDPTDLADALTQHARLPERFVLGALAALRLIGLFIDDWRSLELARRARGVADRGRIRRLGGQGFALLVLSIRRASKLATAMEARGFGGATVRSRARDSEWRGRDWWMIAIGAGIGLASVGAAIATGSGNFIAG